MLGHSSFLDQPHSSSDEVDKDRETDDGEDEQGDDDTGDGTTRETTVATIRLGGGSWSLDGRLEWLEHLGSPARCPGPVFDRWVPGVKVEYVGSGSVAGR